MPKLQTPARAAQQTLFSRPVRTPHWQEIPQDVQQKTLQLLTQLLRQHGASRRAASRAEEACDE